MASRVSGWTSERGEVNLVAPKHLLAVLLAILLLLPAVALMAKRGPEAECISVRDYREDAARVSLRVRNVCRRSVTLESILYESNGRTYTRRLGVILEPGESRIVEFEAYSRGPASIMIVYKLRGVTRTSVVKITG